MTAPVAVGAKAPEQAAQPIGSRDLLQQLTSRFRADRWAMTGLVLVIALAAVAICAPLIAKLSGHGPNQLFPAQLSSQLGLPTGPSGKFFFGVDQNGRDVFVRCLYGLRTSLIISLLSAAIATAVGVTVGR